MKLSCAMIVRDCIDTLETCLKSVRPHVDELVIADTGSIDGTLELARKYADRVELFLGCNNADGLIEDFAAARNRSFDLVTGDWALWIDSDDALEGGENIRPMLEAIHEDNAIIMAPYDYSHDALGRCTCVHWRERIVRPPARFEWQGVVHEYLQPLQPIQGTIQTLRTDGFKIVHRREKRATQGEQGRNLRILKAHVARAGEGDVRALYYIGLEYGYAGDLANALRYLRRYVELSQWSDERCLAMLQLAEHYGKHVGDHRTCIEWALRATQEHSWAEPYWRLGRSYYALARAGDEPMRNYKRAAHFIQIGLNMQTDTVLFVDPLEKFKIHEFLNVCLSATGDLDGAIASCEAGLSGMPENQSLQNNLHLYNSRRNLRRAKDAIDKLELSTMQRSLIDQALAGDFQVEPTEQQSATGVPLSARAPRRAPAAGKLDLVFLLGHQMEPWNPETVAETGIGGSETMAIEMAKRLADRGHAVRLYGQCTPTMEGVFDGVEYLDASRYHDVTCDVVIASRKPMAVDDEWNLHAKAAVLWMHDVHVGEHLNMVRDLRFDRIFALSQWHKRILVRSYPRVDPAKVIVTRNGIDLARFAGEEKRDPHRAIYSSSPDRGLAALLEMWPEIRQRVPDATLHVFYGFLNWETGCKLANNQEGLRALAHLRHLASHTEGVVFRDRVNQTELAREFMRSGVWTYPTWFTETSCITAMEAQAAGCRIVTSGIAALQETVGSNGVVLDWGRPDFDQDTAPLPAYRKQFIDAVVEAMLIDIDLAEIGRAPIIEKASRFDLDPLAEEWDKTLTELVAEADERVVPKFHDAEVAA